MNLEIINSRKQFEAALADLAVLYGMDRAAFRLEVKDFLIVKGLITKSTTELPFTSLKFLGDRLRRFHWKMFNTPPQERGKLDLEIIFNSKHYDSKRNDS